MGGGNVVLWPACNRIPAFDCCVTFVAHDELHIIRLTELKKVIHRLFMHPDNQIWVLGLKIRRPKREL